MPHARQVGSYFQIVPAPSPTNPESLIQLGVRHETFQRNVRLKLSTVIAQYYGIVKDGLVVAEHLFRGVMRPMMREQDTHADESVLIYAWRPASDYEWEGDPFRGRLRALAPPPDRVFVVLVRELQIQGGSVSGEIEWWNWVKEDPELKHAPIDYSVRYRQKLWSRKV